MNVNKDFNLNVNKNLNLNFNKDLNLKVKLMNKQIIHCNRSMSSCNVYDAEY